MDKSLSGLYTDYLITSFGQATGRGGRCPSPYVSAPRTSFNTWWGMRDEFSWKFTLAAI